MIRMERRRNGKALAMRERADGTLAAEAPRPMISNSTTDRPISVWLIEDNHSFRRTVVRVLEGLQDIECTRHFATSEEALDELARGAVPDVVLLDVELPGLNGLEAVKRIKSIAPSSHVIMLTVFDDHDKIFKALCSGASGYLLKTSPMEKIIESVREAYGGGAPLTPRVARSVLDMFSHLRPPTPQGYALTAREQEILELMARGLLKKEIAEKLTL